MRGLAESSLEKPLHLACRAGEASTSTCWRRTLSRTVSTLSLPCFRDDDFPSKARGLANDCFFRHLSDFDRLVGPVYIRYNFVSEPADHTMD